MRYELSLLHKPAIERFRQVGVHEWEGINPSPTKITVGAGFIFCKRLSYELSYGIWAYGALWPSEPAPQFSWLRHIAHSP